MAVLTHKGNHIATIRSFPDHGEGLYFESVDALVQLLTLPRRSVVELDGRRVSAGAIQKDYIKRGAALIVNPSLLEERIKEESDFNRGYEDRKEGREMNSQAGKISYAYLEGYRRREEVERTRKKKGYVQPVK